MKNLNNKWPYGDYPENKHPYVGKPEQSYFSSNKGQWEDDKPLTARELKLILQIREREVKMFREGSLDKSYLN